MSYNDSKLLDFFRKNWKNLVIGVLVITQAMSLIFGWNGYSLVIGLKTGTASAKIEFNDIEIDSTEQIQTYDIQSFKPKPPLYIAVHCTASRSDKNLTKEDLFRIFRERGFPRAGYHTVIDLNGKELELIPLNGNNVIDYNELANGVKGNNSRTISVCYIGGYTPKFQVKDTRNSAQRLAMLKLLLRLKKQFPNAQIRGHRDFLGVHKECPVFNAIQEYSWIK